MKEKWGLKRTKQCAKCPWRKDVDPHDIPNGYCEVKHAALKETIADPDAPFFPGSHPLRIMACHEAHEAHCVGWLVNQLGVGNNIGLRISMVGCENARAIKTIGEQHEYFEDTLSHGQKGEG